MPAVTVRRRSSTLPLVLAVLFVGLVVIVAGFLLYLFAGGSVTVPFTDPPTVLSFQKKDESKPWTPPAGKVAVPRSGRSIPAYTKLSRDDLWDLANNRVAAVYLDEGQIPDGVITDIRQILGRVMKRVKQPGYVFTEDDFLPKDTRPGLVGGIPPGMRGMRIELKDVRGLYGLNPGDRFDLVSTVPLEGNAGDALKKLGGAHASKLAMEAEMNNISKQARVDVVVQNGIVVSPVQTVAVPIATGTLHDPHGMKTKPIQEVVIAVAPAEVAKVTQALAVQAKISVIPRSGHPDDPTDSVTPSSRPWSPLTGDDPEGSSKGGSMHLVEQIGGKNREIVPVPTEKKGE